MKKIIYTLLVAVLALSFMGCPSVYEERYDYSLGVADIIGDMNGDGAPVTLNSDGVTYGYKFTYSADMNAWGGKDGRINFKARSSAGVWDTGICAPKSGDPLEIGGDYVECYYRPNEGGADGANIVVEGLKVGTEYTITFKVEGSNFFVKISD